MSTATGLTAVTDKNLRDLLASPVAALVIGKSDCGHCTRYEQEILAAQAEGGFADIAIGKLLLDAPGSPKFKKENPWLGSLRALPHTLLFVDGKHVENFATSKATYLAERIEAVAAARSAD